MAWRGVRDDGMSRSRIGIRRETRARYRLSLMALTSDEYYEAIYGLEVQVPDVFIVKEKRQDSLSCSLVRYIVGGRGVA